MFHQPDADPNAILDVIDVATGEPRPIPVYLVVFVRPFGPGEAIIGYRNGWRITTFRAADRPKQPAPDPPAAD